MLQTFFNVEIIRAAWPILLAGLGNTVMLSLVVVPLGLLGGTGLALLAGVRNPWVRWPLMAWVDFFRAFPPLVLLILLFAGLPFAGLELSGFACVCIAFFLNTGAYYGEILRAGIESIPAGQAEAARSTGLGRLQTMRYVVLPQAVRNVLPDLLSNTLEVVKLTSLGQRGRDAGAAVPGAAGAEPDLQPHADRAGGDHLLRAALAAGALVEPAREPGAGRGARLPGHALMEESAGLRPNSKICDSAHAKARIRRQMSRLSRGCPRVEAAQGLQIQYFNRAVLHTHHARLLQSVQGAVRDLTGQSAQACHLFLAPGTSGRQARRHSAVFRCSSCSRTRR